MDGERLHAELRGLPPDRRRAGRPPGTAQRVCRRNRDLQPRLGRGGACSEHRGADRRSRAAGTRRGGDRPALADAAERRLLRGEAWARPRNLVRGLRSWRGARTGGRWRRRRGLLLAVDLLAERSHRPGAGAGGARRVAREPRPQRDARPARGGAGQPRPSRCGVRDRPSAGAGMDERNRYRLDRRRRGAAGRLRPVGVAHHHTPAPDPLLSKSRFRRDERSLARDVLRGVRLHLPAGPVLPGGPGLLAARGGHPDAALDGDADLRGPGGRNPVRSHRQPAADGGGPGAPGRRAGLARADHGPRHGLWAHGARVRHGRHWHGTGIRAGGQRGALVRAPRGGRPGLRSDQHHPRDRRGAGGGRALDRVHQRG